MSSNARKKLPAEVLSHPAVVALVDRGSPSGSITPEEVRQASEDAAIEPRHLKGLLTHLSSLGISVHVAPAARQAVAAGAARKTTSASTTKKAPAKKSAASKSAASKSAASKSAATNSAKSSAKKTAAKPAGKAPAAKKAAKGKSAPAITAEEAEPVVVGPDGKKVLPDLPDEQFEKDVKTDPTIEEDEKQASFVVSDADDTGEPEQQVMWYLLE